MHFSSKSPVSHVRGAELDLATIVFLAYFLFRKIKVGLEDHVAVRVCVCFCVSPAINFRTPGPIFMKLGTYITAPESISTA
jgi:hypothetical protein